MEIKKCVLVTDDGDRLEGETTILRDKNGRIVGGTMVVEKPFIEAVDIVAVPVLLSIEGETPVGVKEIGIYGVADNETEIEWKAPW